MPLQYQIIVDDKGSIAIKNLGSATGKTTSLIQKMGKSFNSIIPSVKSMVAAYVGIEGVRKIFSLLSESVNSYDMQELAITKLTTALGSYSGALIDQASALQSTTRYGDELIIDLQGQLATFNLTEQQIKKLTPAILDMAAATGMDLSSSADLVGKSITSSTNALKRYGIDIVDSTSKSERLDSLMKSLNIRFEGQAKAAALAGKGPIVQLTNKFDDLMENVGRGITSFPLFTIAVDAANKVLDVAQNITGGASNEYKILADSIEQDTLPAMINLNDELAKTVKYAPSAGLALATIPKFGDPESIKNIVESFKIVKAEADASAVNISESVNKIKDSIAKSVRVPKKNVSDQIESESNVKKESLFISDPMNKYIQEDVSKLIDIAKSREEQVQQAKQDVKFAMMEEGAEKDIAFMEADFEQRYSLISEQQKTELGLTAALEKAKSDIKNRYARQGLNQMVSDLATAAVQMKEFGGIYKTAAMSQNVIDTYTGATSAFKAMSGIPVVGPALGIAAAGAAIAAGIARGAVIAQQKFASGGIVQGSGGSATDNVMAALSPRERVLSVDQIERMGGNSAIDRAISFGRNKAREISINIQGNILGTADFIRDTLIPEIRMELAR